MANYTEESRNKDFEYFVEHYHDLYETYGHKFLAIRDETVIGHFDSVLDAINSLSDKYEIGSYIIQECTGEESAYRTSIMRLMIRG